MQSVGFVVYPGVEELDLVGPWEMMTMWRSYAGGPEQIVAVAEHSQPITCAKGLRILPDLTFAGSPQFDVIVVPGGFSAFEEAKNPCLVEFVRAQAKGASTVMSVCTGAFILAAAGLLEGRAATTHWKGHAALDALPDISLMRQRYVRDGNIWTSAGVSAGIDMALAFIAATAGETAAGIVQHNAEYYPDGRLYGASVGPDPAAG